MPLKFKNAEIQERDIRIFKFILSCRGCTASQINYKFFKAYNTCAIRLLKLSKFVYLNKERETLTAEYVYTLTTEAMKLLKDKGLYTGQRFKPPRLSLSGKYHDLDVVDLRLVIENDSRLKISEWISDYELASDLNKQIQNRSRTNNRRVADGRFFVSNGNFRRPFILEYIRQDYFKERYYKVLSNIEYMYPFESVLVVCSTKAKMVKYYNWLQDRARNRFPGKYAFTFKASILGTKTLLEADIMKGDGNKPGFRHCWEPMYDPKEKKLELFEGNLNLQAQGIDVIKANKESENF